MTTDNRRTDSHKRKLTTFHGEMKRESAAFSPNFHTAPSARTLRLNKSTSKCGEKRGRNLHLLEEVGFPVLAVEGL
jgi:hypothetical protein